MGLSAKKNYRHNKAGTHPAGTLNGQGLGGKDGLAGMKFGCSTVSYSGCEVIAVYNAQVLSGLKPDFAETARYMERFRVLLGFWGTNFPALGICLRHFGLCARGTRSRKRLREALLRGQRCLFVYWTGKRFCTPVHTVCIEAKGENCLTVYNLYNNCSHPVTVPLDDFLGGRRILGYIISGESDLP